MTEISLWDRLSDINCAAHVEKKGKFNYLSWAWAWAALKKSCPDATFEKHFFVDLPYCIDAQGYAYVKVSVTCEGQTATEVYPVTNNSNQSVKNPDSFAVNTALQRGLTKCMAYHGLGHYIYAGEDLPPDTEAEKPPPQVPDPPQKVDPPIPAAPAAEVIPEFLKRYTKTDDDWAQEQINGMAAHKHLGEHMTWKTVMSKTMLALKASNPPRHQAVVDAFIARHKELTNTGV
jgi:hypothetical protein